MIFLPLVERQLRRGSKKASTQKVRFWTVLGGLILLLVVQMIFSGNPRAMGLWMFRSISGLFLVYALFAGVASTADSISSEKRDGTLGLLLLTDLKAYDIVLGKLIGQGLSGFYCLLAIQPLLVLPLLVGGVSAAEIFRSSFLLLGAYFFSLSCGLLVSVFSRNQRAALFGTLLLLFFTSSLALAAQAIVNVPINWAGFLSVLQLLSPLSIFLSVQDLTFEFGQALGFLCLVSVLFLVITSSVLPLVLRDKEGIHQGKKWISQPVLFKGWRPSNSPYYWLTVRESSNWLVGLMVLLLVVSIAACFVRQMPQPLVWIVLLVAPYLLHQLTKLLLIYEACRRFSLDKTTGNFESIITSPLPSGILVKECAKGLFHRFLSPVLLLTVLNCICLLNAFYLAGGATGYETKLLMLGTVAGIVVLFIDLWSWRWIGMCYGLAAPTMMRSLWEVFLRVRVPAFLSFFFLLLVGVVFGISNELCAFFFCWIGTLAIWSLMAGSRAKKILLQSFHEFAAGQGKIPGLVILEEEEIELKPAQPVLLGTPQEA